MPTITFITNNAKVVTAPENSNLLRISLREKGGIPFKCGGGLCGTCRCRIETGLEHTDAVKPKERNHLSEEELREGYRMACQTFIMSGDVSVSWDPLRKPPSNVAVDREGLVLARAAVKPEKSINPEEVP
jgi:ferredoxin